MILHAGRVCAPDQRHADFLMSCELCYGHFPLTVLGTSHKKTGVPMHVLAHSEQYHVAPGAFLLRTIEKMPLTARRGYTRCFAIPTAVINLPA